MSTFYIIIQYFISILHHQGWRLQQRLDIRKLILVWFFSSSKIAKNILKLDANYDPLVVLQSEVNCRNN